MHWPIDLALAFLMLGLTEAVFKPLAKRFVQRRLVQAAPLVFARLDPLLPQLLQTSNSTDLEARVRSLFEEVTAESWAKTDLDPFFRLLDVRVTAERNRPISPG